MKRENPKILPILLFFTVLPWGYCPAAIIYVDGDAGGGDGTSWAAALVYPQDALAVAQGGDEIYVAAGIYYPDRSTAAPGGSGDPTAAFVLVDGVALRGGYAGVGGADPNDRDFGAFESVLCGDFDDNDTILTTVADLFDDTTRDENSFHVVIASGVDEETVLEGFTIRGGSRSHIEDIDGGGMLVESAAPAVINCRFVYNVGELGGGMANVNSSPLVINCMFIGNWAYNSGGGVYDDSADAVFMNCLFSGNRAEDYGGGGVFHNGGDATFNNCTFSGNWASDGGNGIYAETGIVEISNCIIQEEISLDGGSVVARYSNLPGGPGGEGGIDADPLFVDADGEDDIFGTVDDNLRPAVDSPCINAGDPMRMTDPNETDLDGRQRINDGAVDMGAYEFFTAPALVGHWKLDEDVGSTAYDSVGANDGSLEGDPNWMPGDGRIDGSLAFDGAGDYVNCGASKVFDIRNEITVSAWIRIDELTDSWRPIVTKGNNAWRLQAGSFDNDPGTLQFACTGLSAPGGQWGDITGNVRVDDGLWHHAAGVYDGAQISLYIDGVLDAASVASGQININDYDVLIGGNAQEPGRFFNGLIDDVGVYNYALSPDDIAALANPNPSTVFHVDGAGGNDDNDGLSRETAFATINRGIIQAVDDDTVLVWPGVYNEQVYFQGKPITVCSAADAAVVQTVVGYAFSFQDGEGPDSVLSNFIIRNSYRAIYCMASSPTIKNMTIVNNDFGIRVFGGAEPDISNCIFWNNAEGNTEEGCQSCYSWDWEPVAAAAHWKFDEGGGPTVYDSVGSSHGTVYGPVWTQGQVKGALGFNVNTDYVLVPNNPAISVGTGNYTLSAWIKPELTSYIHVIMSKISSHLDKEYMLSIDRDRIRLDVEKNGNDGRAYSVEVVRLDTWQHVAVTFDASSPAPAFYYNGLPVEQSVSADPITLEPNSLGADLWIGRWGGAAAHDDRGFIGAIDEVMIFNRALSAEEMQVVYKSQLSPLFADPANNDYHLLSEKGRFVPLDPDVNNGLEGLWTFDAVTSPCIDGGDPAETPWRERMPNGGRVNLGAYGNTLYASMSRWPIEGDINRTGVVNLADLAIMARQWLSALPWAAGG